MEAQPLTGGEGGSSAAAVQGFVTRVHSNGLCDVKYSGEDDARRSVKKLKLRSERLYVGMRVEALVHRDGDRFLGKNGTPEWCAAAVEMVHGGGVNYDVRLAKSGRVASHLRRVCVACALAMCACGHKHKYLFSFSLCVCVSVFLPFFLSLSHHPHHPHHCNHLSYLRCKGYDTLEAGDDIEWLQVSSEHRCRWTHGTVASAKRSVVIVESDTGSKKTIARSHVRIVGTRCALRVGMTVNALPEEHDSAWHTSEVSRATIQREHADGSFDIVYQSSGAERRRVRPAELAPASIKCDEAVDVYCKLDSEWGWAPATVIDAPERGRGANVEFESSSVNAKTRGIPRSRLRKKNKRSTRGSRRNAAVSQR